MTDRFTETTSTSWFSRLGGAIKGIFAGIILFFGSIILLWWNEGRAVQTAKGLEEGSSSVIEVDASNIVQENNGKLVYISGSVFTNDTLKDEQFGVSAHAIHLKRNVEIFLWKESIKSEKRKKIGGGEETIKTYDYKKDWSPRLIESSAFKIQEGHENPNIVPYDEINISASNISLGKYDLTNIINNFQNETPVVFNDLDSSYYADSSFSTTIVQNTGDKSYIYRGNGSFLNPKIGDLRISFTTVSLDNYSIIGKQANNTIETYTTSHETSILMLNKGVVSAHTMFKQAESNNKILTWILRLVGAFAMYLSVIMVLKPISVIADVLPFLGNIVEFGLSLLAGIFSLSISLIVISLAWIFYRPIIGALLLSIVFVLFIIWRKRSKSSISQKS